MSSNNENLSMQNTVSVNKGSLVLSLPNALEPVVWQMDIKQAKAAGFTVKESVPGKWALVKKSPDNTETQIALFETKDDAMNILMDVSEGLQGGSKGTHNCKHHAQEPHSNVTELKKWGIAAGGVIIVIGLFFYLASIVPQSTEPFMNEASIQTNASTPNATGVPVSADAFLSSQE